VVVVRASSTHRIFQQITLIQHAGETKMAEAEVVDIPGLSPRLKLLIRLPPSLRVTIRFGLSTLVGVFVTLFSFLHHAGTDSVKRAGTEGRCAGKSG